MNEIKPFMYGSNEVRTVSIQNEPWFIAKDVCDVLEIGNPSDALRRLDEDERTLVSIEGASNGLPVNAVNEPGLYTLILGSRKAEAKQFKRWITHEVIPSIRKHGAYITPETMEQTLKDPDYIIGVITALKKEQDARKALEKKVVADEPKVLFANSLQASKDCILVANLAKLLKQNGIDTGERRLYSWLRENGYLGKKGEHYNMPTQRSMDLRLFEVKTGVINKPDEEPRTTKTTVVTTRGQMYFLNKFRGHTA
ncbi:phage antirepressor Ant [Paenibacillus sp. Aloe-11]|uniref:phage antirepressor Ant n=1 Tax=Paenibacillus sp. Aloe-11 TaxID=1050222 RepID=UPI00024EFE67|nr:phage antirepressor Ant [Paenibacillus sp. Aloe-11]EHS59409.1 putative phage antirepressor [Paenibacillus sp. Aloe-11]